MKIKLTIMAFAVLISSALFAETSIVGRWEELKELKDYPGSHAAIVFTKDGSLVFEGPGAAVFKWKLVNPKLIKVSGQEASDGYQIKIQLLTDSKLTLQFGNGYMDNKPVQYRRTVYENPDDATSKTPAAAEYSVNDHIQVEWNGTWYPAVILQIKDKKYLIHYDGFESSWDEWVSENRMKR